ncbi:MAG: hypothetical protein ACFCUM_10365 [Bacteroidales bacterium]
MNKSDLEKIVDIRLSESNVLLSSEKYSGAYYLAGYAIECALKACIAKKVNKYDFPDKKLASKSYSHDLDELVGVAGLRDELNAQIKKDKEFKLNWAVANIWNETSRYECIEKTKANDLLNAITDNKSGVLVWLKTFW